MTRKCSHCSHNGHNSRTCPHRGVKLFGVRLTDGLIRKSASMGNLSHYMGGGGGSSGGGTTPQNGAVHDSPDHDAADGYASEDFVAGSGSSRERKRGVPWTEEEHRMFLLGLQKLGKGDWRGIARTYVITRTPTQVASHAQKYFIRQCNVSRRKRRSSLFDIVADDSADTPLVSRDFFPANPDHIETESNFPAPPPALDEECEYMESADSNDGDAALPSSEASQYPYQSASSNDVPAPEGLQYPYPVVYPAYVAPFFPMPVPIWAGYNAEPVKVETHEVLRPTPVHSKSPINVDELVGMSNLSIGENLADAGPTTVSLELVEGSERPSAFHANPGSGGSGLKSSHNPIHAV